jgi:hypothetical protein
MQMLMDGLLMAASLFAGIYCWILARRVHDLKSLDKGLGGSIVTLTRQVELARTTLEESRGAAAESREELGKLIARAELSAKQLRLIVAASRDTEQGLASTTAQARAAAEAASEALAAVEAAEQARRTAEAATRAQAAAEMAARARTAAVTAPQVQAIPDDAAPPVKRAAETAAADRTAAATAPAADAPAASTLPAPAVPVPPMAEISPAAVSDAAELDAEDLEPEPPALLRPRGAVVTELPKPRSLPPLEPAPAPTPPRGEDELLEALSALAAGKRV